MSAYFPALEVQSRLHRLNQLRMLPSALADTGHHALSEESALRRLELEFVKTEREQVRALAQEAPQECAGFAQWFNNLEHVGPGQNDPLFPWLAEEASREQMLWFLQQEAAGEAGFDDLVALTQLKLPSRSKMAMARNYWDEMGCGRPAAMHSTMLEELQDALNLRAAPSEVLWQSQALGNLMCALAGNRFFAYQGIGALGVIELTAPGRAAAVNRGLKRLAIPGRARRYYAVHATLDIHHAQAWVADVFVPLIDANPALATCFAEGALMRLNAGARVFKAYRAHLFAQS